MQLNTFSERIDRRSARVFWRSGTSRSGILDISLEFDSADSDVLAELVAIRFLVLQKKIFGVEPMCGKGLKFVVSKGAIKKLVRGASSKKHAVKFAAFLSGRLSGVQIEVSKDKAFMPKVEDTAIESHLAATDYYTATFEAVSTPSMGDILVTQHAIDQYIDRIDSGAPQRPFASLVKRLQHPALQQIPLPVSVLKHKKKKYGRSDNVEAWSHPDSGFVYLFLNDRAQKVLVTVFRPDKKLAA